MGTDTVHITSAVVAVLLSASASFLISYGVRECAPALGLIDEPNARSSHTSPTPRGGGLGVVVGILLGLGVLRWVYDGLFDPYLVLVAAMLVVASVGMLDDLRGVPRYWRILVHLVAAVSVVWYLSRNDILVSVSANPWADLGLAAFSIVAFTNIFNFMDGIDGLAACELLFMALSAGLLLFLIDGDVVAVLTLLVISAAAAGFLPLNWPRATVFMGDIGSASLGFLIAAIVFTKLGGGEGVLPVWVWGILAGAFLVDAAVTLATRMLTGQRWLEAHRLHSYQKLARRWDEHRKVVVVISAVNMLWLLPVAMVAVRMPEYAAVIMLLAWCPLIYFAIRTGAGQSDQRQCNAE